MGGRTSGEDCGGGLENAVTKELGGVSAYSAGRDDSEVCHQYETAVSIEPGGERENAIHEGESIGTFWKA